MKKFLTLFFLLVSLNCFAHSMVPEDYISLVKDFPKPGVQFIDFSKTLESPDNFDRVVTLMIEKVRHLEVDAIVAVDARGFIFGSVLAREMNKPLILARKPKKLPGTTKQCCYLKEYGQDCIEVQAQQLKYQNYLIVDDVLATGGTVSAVEKLMKDNGAVEVNTLVLVILKDLLKNNSIQSHLWTLWSL